jgi:hypothetical protein
MMQGSGQGGSYNPSYGGQMNSYQSPSGYWNPQTQQSQPQQNTPMIAGLQQGPSMGTPMIAGLQQGPSMGTPMIAGLQQGPSMQMPMGGMGGW